MEQIYKNHAKTTVRTITDESIGLRGYLVIGSRINGQTCGGLRIHKNVGIQELTDLAKVMELKQTFLGLPRGGCRAGIVAPYDIPQDRKQDLMNRFAELTEDQLSDRKWLVAIDIGTNIDLVHKMYEHVGINIPKPSRGIANAGYFTALSVMKSIELSLTFQSLKIENCTFAIEGMGNVGRNLFEILIARDAKVIALSNIRGAIYNASGISVAEGISMTHADKPPKLAAGTEHISATDLLQLPVDVLCPCATDSTINSSNVAKIHASVICAGANNPVTYPAIQRLHRRKILYLPDFMTNSGGALGNMVKFAGLQEKHLHAVLNEEFDSALRHLYAESKSQSKPPAELAVHLIERKFAGMKHALELANKGNAIREIALTAYRSGLFPKILIRPFALRKIRNSIGLYWEPKSER